MSRTLPLAQTPLKKPSPFRRIALAACVGAALALSACSGSQNAAKDNYIEGSVEDLYNRGQDLLLAEEYKEAAKFFNEVDRQHPYSSWAARAQLMAGYSYYRAGEYALATATLNRFVRLHPGYRDIAYAYYLRALIEYDQVRDVKRDQTHTAKALDGFRVVTRRFPNSKYARDSRRKVALLLDHMAGHEMEVGRYYQKRGQHLAAINRFKVVIDRYQTTRQVPEALHRMAESYTALGVTGEARRVAAVLGYNYPASEWYVDSYELVENKKLPRRPAAQQPGLIRRIVDFLF